MPARSLARAMSRRILDSRLASLLAGPGGVDAFTELVDATWTRAAARAKVVSVARTTTHSVTMLLAPNSVFSGFRAGQHMNVTVMIDGRQRTRCYSPANADSDELLELTVSVHPRGLVSGYLFDRAHVGMVVGISDGSGDFVLPEVPARRILFVSGGSGITPVMSMLRTLRARGTDSRIAVIHYAKSPETACYRGALDTATNLRVLHGYSRDIRVGQLHGRFCAAHADAAMPDADAVYVCGPPTLVDAVHDHRPDAHAETFVSRLRVPQLHVAATVTFSESGVSVPSDGRPLLQQAEAAGLTPASGCRMGICRTCTRTKHSGVVRNVLTGEASAADREDIQICSSVPLGDVSVAL